MHNFFPHCKGCCVDFQRPVLVPHCDAGIFLTQRDDAGKILGVQEEVTGIASIRWRCVKFSVAQHVLGRFFTQEVGLHHSGSAVRQSGRLCVEFLATRKALLRFFTQEVSLHHSGLTLQRFLGCTTAVHHLRQAVCPFLAHKEFPEEMKGVILTPAVMDRRGQGWREHRQQAGGAPQGILTAAVWPRSDAENRRSPAGFPLPFRILHGGAARCAAMGFLTAHTAILFLAVLPPGTGWRYGLSWGPWEPLQCLCQWHGHCRGPRKRAPLCISVLVGRLFCTGLAGGLLAAARQPSAKARIPSAVFRPRSGILEGGTLAGGLRRPPG
ncbi:hypothetical protein NDU88_009980 [Pleurodeles waltl]|uniref:Uncharacterized protein n=1 Tax=Pleurodeles waltl TaxID=8319 RepID=A0AAV7S1Y8_PLEWA|nr:hypothetical protein NDU88_009980 [Pleurodeles waltl]